jgi:hypothetical protein
VVSLTELASPDMTTALTPARSSVLPASPLAGEASTTLPNDSRPRIADFIDISDHVWRSPLDRGVVGMTRDVVFRDLDRDPGRP